MKPVKFSLEYWKKEIENQVKHNGSRTIIAVALNTIQQKFGIDERNKIVKKYKLDVLYGIEIIKEKE